MAHASVANIALVSWQWGGAVERHGPPFREVGCAGLNASRIVLPDPQTPPLFLKVMGLISRVKPPPPRSQL